STGGTQVCGGVQTFYVPRNPAGDLSILGNYYRYQITEGGADVVRAEYGDVSTSDFQDVLIDGHSPYTGELTNGTMVTRYLEVLADSVLDVVIENTESRGSTRTLSYRVRSPSGTSICNGTRTKGNSRTCTISPTVAGQY